MPVCKTSVGTNKKQRKSKFSAAELLLRYASKCLHKGTAQRAMIVQTLRFFVTLRTAADFASPLKDSNIAKGCKTEYIHHEHICSKCTEKFEGNFFCVSMIFRAVWVWFISNCQASTT
jgi:hypothetical protein